MIELEPAVMKVNDLWERYNQFNEYLPEPSPDEMRCLRHSITRFGLLTPLIVLPQGAVVCGRKRLRALKTLQARECPVLILKNPIIDREVIDELQFAEALTRHHYTDKELFIVSELFGRFMRELKAKHKAERLALQAEHAALSEAVKPPTQEQIALAEQTTIAVSLQEAPTEVNPNGAP